MIEQAILVGLASFRIANLLVNEDGPDDIFEKLRIKVGLVPGEVTGFLPKLFSCLWCMSIWTSIIVFLLWQLEPLIVILIASMTIALLANTFCNR